MNLYSGNLELRPTTIDDVDTYDEFLHLAMGYKWRDYSLDVLEKHMRNEIYQLWAGYVNGEFKGFSYISKRKVGDIEFYTLDGYAKDKTDFKYSIKAGQLTLNHFYKGHKVDIFSQANKKTGVIVLLKTLGFKAVLSDDKYIYYRKEYKGD